MDVTGEETGGVVTTDLSGELRDQSALMGVLNALVDLHMTVLSVECVDRTERAGEGL